MEQLHARHAVLPPAHPGHAVLAAPALWDALVDLSPSSALDSSPTTLTVALEPLVHSYTPAKGPRALVVVARQATKADLASSDLSTQDDALLVPHALAAAHPLVFARRSSSSSSPTSPAPATLLLSLTTPIPLSSVVLVALDSPSYAHAAHPSDGRSLESRLADSSADLVREGGTLRLSGVGRYRVAMAEPVLQGVVVGGQTQVLVLPPQGGDDHRHEPLPDAGSSHGGELQHDEATEDDDHDVDDDDLLDFEIDEGFLAGSVLSPLRSSSTPLTSPLPDSKHSSNGSSFPLLAASTASLAAAAAATRTAGSTVTAAPLAHPVPAELLVPPPDAGEDDIARAYVATADLGRLGLFSGDWAVLSRRAGEGEGRLARVFAAEGLVAGTETSTRATPTVHVPPSLLFNLLGPDALSASSSPSLHLLPAPRISPILPAPLPTASSVTIARLASPLSVNKVFQPLFLEGLKEHFSRCTRAVKKGDVIAVGIDEERVRFAQEGKEGAPHEDEVDLPAAPTAPTAVVHFLVTSLSVEPPTSSTAATGDFDLDRQLEDGALGCFVDPKVTKLLQTGVERGRVPDVAGWMGVAPSPSVPLVPDAFGTPTPGSRLLAFLLSSLTPRASTYALPLTVLLKGARGSGKRVLLRCVTRAAGVGLLELDCFDLLGESDAKTEGRLRALAVDKALACAPVVLVLRNIEALARKSQAMETGQEPPMTTVLRDCIETIREGWKTSGHPVVVVATTTDVDKVPTGVVGLFKEEIGIEAPGEPERLAILRSLTSADLLAPDVSLRALAVQTAALVANDLVDLVRRARAAAAERVLALPSLSTAPPPPSSSTSSSSAPASAPTLADLAHAGVALTSLDFNSALDKARAAYSESIGAPKIPNVTWDDVGGLASVKSDILDTIQLPLERPELFRDGLKKRSGILLYGPPGTGKTLLAKAVATSCSLNFFSVKGPELLNMYIGESEANVRRVFQRARDAKPCVIFFDELDSVAPKRGNQGDSGGVMDRIVSQLLAELDGMSEGKGGNDVFVIGATNRPDLLDPALLRPGRFDRMLYLGVSDNHAAQLNIMRALTRKFKLAPETDLAKLAEQCPYNYTGADFYALCSDAMLKAMTRKATEVDDRIAELNAQPPYSTGAAPALTPQYYLAELATPQEIEVLVAQQDFEAALAELVPSVSQAEMLHYKTVQSRFSAETLNSDDKLAAKEAEAAAAAKQDSSSSSSSAASAGALQGPVEQVKPNGVVPNGVVADAPAQQEDGDAQEEQERQRRRKAKGKGKARAD
ncbi:hypothetical protein JCM8208_007299 [Rhodotorula glutinis]